MMWGLWHQSGLDPISKKAKEWKWSEEIMQVYERDVNALGIYGIYE